MNKNLQIELLKKDVSFKDKEIDRLEEENKKLKEEPDKLKSDYSMVVTECKKLKGEVNV